MLKLGILYFAGQAVPQDYQESRKWLEKAAALQQPKAIYNLGIFYLQGLGVGKDPSKARDLLERAGKLGDKDAQAALAKLGPAL